MDEDYSWLSGDNHKLSPSKTIVPLENLEMSERIRLIPQHWENLQGALSDIALVASEGEEETVAHRDDPLACSPKLPLLKTSADCESGSRYGH